MANLSNINGKFVVEQTTGYVGVGTTDPNYPIEVLNASAEIALNASSGSIYRVQSDSTDAFRINKNGVGDRLVILGGGNVGIGTDSPDTKLDVNGEVVISPNTDGKQTFKFTTNAADDGRLLIKSVDTVKVDIQANGNSYLNGGNVGIGAISLQPWARLQVAGTAGAQTGAKQALLVTSPSTTAGEGVGIRMSAASGSNEAVGIIGVVNNASGNSGSMTFHTYNAGADIPERMRITSSGQVGIGGTPQTTFADSITIEIGASGIIYSEKAATQYNSVSIGSNWYYDTTNSRVEYKNTDVAGATNYLQYQGKHFFRTAVAPTAANDPITWSDRLVILNSGNVGIGTVSPLKILTVKKATSTNTIATSEVMRLAGTAQVVGNKNELGFANYDNDYNASVVIGAEIMSTLAYLKQDLYFATRDSTSDIAPTERMRITSGGTVEIPGGSGIAQSIAKLDVRVNGSAIEFGHTNNTDWYFGTVGAYGSAGNPFISFSCWNEQSLNTWTTKGVKGNIIAQQSNGNLQFQHIAAINSTVQTPTLNMELYDDGRLYPLGGVFLGSANNDQLLSYYKEGSWTPTLSFGGNTVGITYGGAAGTFHRGGHYTRVGRVVTFSFRIILTSKGTSTGEATITGLPFIVANLGGNYGSAMWSFANNFLIPERPTITMDNNSSTIRLRYVQSNGNYGNVTNSDFNNNSDFILTGTYQAAPA